MRRNGISPLIQLVRTCSWRRGYKTSRQPTLSNLTLAALLALLLPFTAALSQTPEEAAAMMLVGSCRDVNPQAQTEFGQFCSRAFDVPISELSMVGQNDIQLTNEELRQVAWEENATKSTLSVEVSNSQLGNLGARLDALRQGAVLGFDFRGLSLDVDSQTIRGLFLASLEEEATNTPETTNPNNRLGVFVNGTVSIGDRDETSQENSFDFDTVGITGGIDYSFTDNFIIGLAIGYASMDADFDELDDEVEVTGYSASLYSTYYIEDLYVDFIASAGLNDYETTRNLKLTTLDVFETANGDTDGTQYSLGLGAGYEYKVVGAILGPYVQLNYFNADIDDFTETGGDVINLEIGDQDIDSLISVVGGQASYTIRTESVDLVPQARAEWWHEFKNDSRLTTASFVNDLGPSVWIQGLPTGGPDRDYFNLGVGLLGVMSEAASAFLEYQTVLGLQEITNHIVRAQLRLNF